MLRWHELASAAVDGADGRSDAAASILTQDSTRGLPTMEDPAHSTACGPGRFSFDDGVQADPEGSVEPLADETRKVRWLMVDPNGTVRIAFG
jgi:hypothetical protein